MRPKLWLIAGLMSAALFIIAGCGGGQDGGGAGATATTRPADTQTPIQDTAVPADTKAPSQESGGSGGGGASDLVSQGKDLFPGTCASCHAIEGISAGLVGPDLTHIGTQGSERKTGLSAKEYITESIRDPEAFVATGVERAIPGIMTQGLTAGLSDGEVDALVAFLSAQK